MRVVALTTGGGVDRRRTKGSPQADQLYELINGFRNDDGTLESRPGTVQEVELPPDTVGLAAYNDILVVFSHTPAATGNALFEVIVLIDPEDSTAEIREIHFAAPFLGYLYVVAEFDNDNVYHYWLQETTTWAANTATAVGDVVQPTVPNGLAYRAHRLGAPYPQWAPSVQRAVADIIEPTAGGKWKHTVKEVIGTNPRSGLTEPTWSEEDGGLTYEDSDGSTPTTTTESGAGSPDDQNPSGAAPVPEDVGDRYGTQPPGEGPPTSEF